jgi:hypothetical protein
VANAGAGVGRKDLACGGTGVFENDSGGSELRGDAGGEDGSHAAPKDDEVAGPDVAGVSEVCPGCDGVFRGEALGGVGAVTQAEPAVVESKDVNAEGVESCEGGDAVGKGTVGVVEIEHRVSYILGIQWCGDVPAIESRVAGFVNVETNFVEGNCWFGGDGSRGVEEELPLALIEE